MTVTFPSGSLVSVVSSKVSYPVAVTGCVGTAVRCLACNATRPASDQDRATDIPSPGAFPGKKITFTEHAAHFCSDRAGPLPSVRLGGINEILYCTLG